MNPNVVTRSSAKQSKVRTRAQQAATEAEQEERRVKLYGGYRSTGKGSIAEAKKQGKLRMSATSQNGTGAGGDQRRSSDFTEVQLKDIFQNAQSGARTVRGPTGILYDERFALHRCLWDTNYPECPERYLRVMERFTIGQLVDRCQFIAPRPATRAELLTKHTAEQIELLAQTHGSQDEPELERLSSHYDAIFIHPTSYETSVLAVGSTIQLVESVWSGTVQNGMAILRPPGHHAMTAEYNGYCFFNNVAIAAQHALDHLGTQKIMIVDWDVHHGQGTQRMFYSDPRVLYFSIHRYEHGTFWPNLRESDFDYVGTGKGEGYNFNVPLNKTGMTNGDYLAIWQQLLLPVATEFAPELIIVSAGYDSALGDEKGCMEITPAFYSHLLSPLLLMAQGRVAVVLEGGYCLESLAEGCALTLKTLLGDPAPRLTEALQPPSESMQASILNCIYSHRKYWKCLQLYELYDLEDYNNTNPQDNFHKVIKCYVPPEPPAQPGRYETRNCYPVQSADERARIQDRLARLHLATDLSFPPDRVCYVYDELMLEHRNSAEKWHPEQPERIAKIMQRLTGDYQLAQRMKRLPGRLATTEELCLVHGPEHVRLIGEVCQSSTMKQTADQYNSIYFHPSTDASARMATGSVLTVVEDVLEGRTRSGVCVVRPPGHHAEADTPHGFCIYNSIAVAARHAVKRYGLRRVLIVDWDVHHGNGTQHIFEQDPHVLYISVHRYDNGAFFPRSTDADYTVVGSGPGRGFNVNIPWNRKGMGDPEYVAAFHSVILPIAYEYEPELVLVSAGFDAAIGDPLGGCRVTPEAYGHFTQWLSVLAGGRLVLCLEGGYNVNSISHAMAMCTKALLGDPLPMLLPVSGTARTPPATHASCCETLWNVLSVQRLYWRSLCFNKKLPSSEPLLEETGSELIEALDNMTLSERGGTDKQQPQQTTSSTPSSSSAAKAASSGGEQAAGSSKQPSQTLTEFLEANLEALQNEEMFAVIPRRDCPHLKLLRPETAPEAIDTRTPCSDCSAEVENWICLLCFGVYCGRYVNEHMLRHGTEAADHPLALSFADLSVWCYGCDAYIDHPALHHYKSLVHQDKFHEPLVWSYGSDLVLDVVPGSSSGRKAGQD
ncbi:histone deacetylase 6 isoform X2 [Anopheles arabiensis]|uniref:Protein deacetylase HDAC6 n=2 Tax=Anopheles arabiensis TaxID=7173 RepID=A0A2C9GN14_ANOAR|nr:histone deacetylase 6 isoform X2 [Anopheles arabiensis]